MAKFRWLAASVFFCCLFCHATVAGENSEAVPSQKRYAVHAAGHQAVPRVAIDNVCAWPILTKMPDGTIAAMIFSKPSHGRLPGDVECWATADDGATWTKRGVAAGHDNEQTNRMSKAVGLAANRDLVVISAGWTLIPKENVYGHLDVDKLLRPIVCRSSDGGKNWTVNREGFPEAAPDGLPFLPNGSIREGKDGRLRMAAYTNGQDKVRRIYVVRSDDDGKTWGNPTPIDPDANLNETYLWTDGSGWWLAVARNKGLELYESTDDAATWGHVRTLTGDDEVPGQILKLNDGRLLLMNGNRIKGKEGVEVRVSGDRGRTWSEPVRLVDFLGYDGGYPSSAQLKDGRVLTAFYARKTDWHDGYHMGTVIWDPTRTFPPTGTAPETPELKK